VFSTSQLFFPGKSTEAKQAKDLRDTPSGEVDRVSRHPEMQRNWRRLVGFFPRIRGRIHCQTIDLSNLQQAEQQRM